MVLGAQKPRVLLVPDGVDHPKWSEVVDFVKALGVSLDEWQWLVLRESLKRAGEFWAAFAVAVCAPRQNGKNGILEVRQLVGAVILEEKLQIHTAHLADTSKESFGRLDLLLEENEWLSKDVKHIWRTNGHEAIEFKNKRRIRFRTRTKGGGRGFSGSPVYFDESMFLPEVSMGAIMPVISAQPDPQVWYMGSAVDQEVMEDGTVFARVRERALAGDDPRLAYFEWSLDYSTPSEVTEETAADPRSWAETNPALGIRITETYIQAERAELGNRAFAVERLGVGDWPTGDVNRTVIDMERWAELTDERSKLLDPVVLAFDVSPDRSTASIAAAGRREDGLLHGEVVEHRKGTGWVTDRVAELDDGHAPAAILYDAAGPASSLAAGLEEKGVTVTPVTARELADACGFMYDTVADSGLRHLGTGELRSALRGAAQRSLGDAWAWSRRSSTVDICPLVAFTLALWGAETAPGGDYVVDVSALAAA